MLPSMAKNVIYVGKEWSRHHQPSIYSPYVTLVTCNFSYGFTNISRGAQDSNLYHISYIVILLLSINLMFLMYGY